MLRKKKGALTTNTLNHCFIPIDKLNIIPLKKKINEIAKIWICETRVSDEVEAPSSLGFATRFTSSN